MKLTSVWAIITQMCGNFETEFLEEIRRWNLCLSSNTSWALHKAFPPLDAVRTHPSAESPGRSMLWWDSVWHGPGRQQSSQIFCHCSVEVKFILTWAVMLEVLSVKLQTVCDMGSDEFWVCFSQIIKSVQCISMKNFIYRYKEHIT